MSQQSSEPISDPVVEQVDPRSPKTTSSATDSLASSQVFQGKFIIGQVEKRVTLDGKGSGTPILQADVPVASVHDHITDWYDAYLQLCDNDIALQYVDQQHELHAQPLKRSASYLGLADYQLGLQKKNGEKVHAAGDAEEI